MEHFVLRSTAPIYESTYTGVWTYVSLQVTPEHVSLDGRLSPESHLDNRRWFYECSPLIV